MAEGGGLFSGLKFSDIFFPAAASVASAYNPYIGYGIQTGLNVFNSAADFQQNLRQYKMLQEEQQKYDENLQQGREAAGIRAGELEKELAAMRDREMERISGDIDKHGVYGSEGPTLPVKQDPAKYSDITGLPTAFNVFGDKTLEGQGVSGPQLLPEHTKFSDVVPMTVNQRVEAALAENPDYAALRGQLADTEFMGRTMGLAPGAAVSTIGILGEQAHGSMLEKARMLKVYEDQQKAEEAKFLRKSLARNEASRIAMEEAETRHRQALERQDHYARITTEQRVNPDRISDEDINDKQRYWSDLRVKHANVWFPTDPDDQAFMAMIEDNIAYWSNLQEERRRGRETTSDNGTDTGTDTGTDDPKARADAILNQLGLGAPSP